MARRREIFLEEESAAIFDDRACRLGEGATYDPRSATVFWFDIVERKLLEKGFPDGELKVHDLPLMASALAVVDERRQLLATEKGLYLRDSATGALELHAPIEADNAVTRSNDARVHPCGALWVGTMGRNAEYHAGAIYWYFRGEVRRLYPDLTIPNAICFAPDGAAAYFADTNKNILFRVDCDPDTGLPLGAPQVLLDHRGKPGGIDGAVTDAEGVIWNARWGAGRIDAYAPDGRHIRSVPVPARQTSCPAFVGAAADAIIVTTAWQDMNAAARAADPLAGRTFLLDLPVKGRFEPRVAI